MNKLLVPLLGLALLAQHSTAQTATDFKTLLTGTGLPSSMKIADIPDSYKAARLKVSGNSASGGGLGDMMSMMMLGMMSSFASLGSTSSHDQPPPFLGLLDVSWTEGTVVTVSGGDFLITYSMEIDMAEMAATQGKAGPPPLKLKLIRTTAINSFQPIPELTRQAYQKAMDGMGKGGGDAVLATEIMDNAPTGAPTAASYSDQDMARLKSETLSNLKQVAVGMMMYASDYDDVLPYVQGSTAAHYVTQPYIKNREVSFSKNPNGPERFHFNINLGGVKLGDVESPAETPLFVDPKAWPGGTRLVAFVDGHVKSISAESWPEVETRWKKKYRRTAKKPLPADTGIGFSP